jgi:hypothetical protein
MPLGPKELWAESVRRYEARRTDNYRRERIDFHPRMRRVHWGLGDEHDAALEALGTEKAKN